MNFKYILLDHHFGLDNAIVKSVPTSLRFLLFFWKKSYSIDSVILALTVNINIYTCKA